MGGVCVTFTGVCVLTQVIALSAVTLVRAVDVNTLVTAWTAQTLIHICIMTHTHSGSVNRILRSRIQNHQYPSSMLEKCYGTNSISVSLTAIPCEC